MDFGDKLKQYRLKEGLSQEQLAEKIGVSRQAITKWETKRGLPDVENMIILAELFKLTLDELVLEEVKKQEEKPVIFESETVYDIDMGKHFDINLGGARKITIKTGVDEKIHIVLSSFLAIFYMPAIYQVVFEALGVMKNSFEISYGFLMLFAVAQILVNIMISIILCMPIRKISAYALIKE